MIEQWILFKMKKLIMWTRHDRRVYFVDFCEETTLWTSNRKKAARIEDNIVNDFIEMINKGGCHRKLKIVDAEQDVGFYYAPYIPKLKIVNGNKIEYEKAYDRAMGGIKCT